MCELENFEIDVGNVSANTGISQEDVVTTLVQMRVYDRCQRPRDLQNIRTSLQRYGERVIRMMLVDPELLSERVTLRAEDAERLEEQFTEDSGTNEITLRFFCYLMLFMTRY